MTGTIPKDHRPLARRAKRAGWRVVPGSHMIKWYPPDGGRPISSPSSVSTKGRKTANLRAALRRAGLEV